jgi:Permuted papain-like amidase enzyme, YaeF/YiiX, C92 family
MRRLSSAVLAAIIMCSIHSPSAFALSIVPRPITPPKAPLALTKPAAPAHPDTAPSIAGDNGVVARDPATGVPDALEVTPPDPAALAAEDATAAACTRAVDAGSSSGSGDFDMRVGDGKNSIGFGHFTDGDIVVVLDGWSVGHAGIFDRSSYASINSWAVLSANMTPVNGVQREQCIKYRNYDRSYGLWVPSQYHHHLQARQFAQRQIGKPYVLSPIKTDTRSYYCSKLVWCAWRYTAGIDLDADNGLYVWPVDLINSPLTTLFGYWN